MSGFSFVLLLSTGFLLSFLLRIASFGQFGRPAPPFAQGLACVIHVELPVLFNLTWQPSQFVTDKQKEKKNVLLRSTNKHRISSNPMLL